MKINTVLFPRYNSNTISLFFFFLLSNDSYKENKIYQLKGAFGKTTRRENINTFLTTLFVRLFRTNKKRFLDNFYGKGLTDKFSVVYHHTSWLLRTISQRS